MKFNKFDGYYNIIGNNLKNIRESKNISQEQLSNKLALLGITLYQSDIFKIEHNERTVRDFELWGICNILEIKAEDLFEPNTNKK
jgi:transcriptional regulator with XRE-family HTH domain